MGFVASSFGTPLVSIEKMGTFGQNVTGYLPPEIEFLFLKYHSATSERSNIGQWACIDLWMQNYSNIHDVSKKQISQWTINHAQQLCITNDLMEILKFS